MTTSSDRGRFAEYVGGIVQGANERCVHLEGEPEWRNFSKYSDRIVAPGRGARVRLGLDSSGFVREVRVLDQPISTDQSSAERSREIGRLTVLKAAAHFLGLMSQTHEEVKSEHVLVLADKWLAWVEQGPPEVEHPGGD